MAETQRRCHLPRDLLRVILRSLLVKSLVIFRCVSKSRLSLVDDDADFARSHLNNFKNNCDESDLLLFQGKEQDCVVHCSETLQPKSETLLSLGNMRSKWYVVSFVDGLVLLGRDYRFGEFRALKLWNPSIRKFREIPPLKQASSSLRDKDIGFGYDPLANDYKLVKLIFAGKTLHSLAIYGLGAGSWKTIEFLGKGSNWHFPVYEGSEPVFFRSSLYFIAMDETTDGVRYLVGFDLSKEEFSTVRMPEDPCFKSSPYKWWRLSFSSGLDDGMLQVFDGISTEIAVWALDSESMCWTKRRLCPSEESRLLYIKKNGDMLTWRNGTDTFADETGNIKWVCWVEVGSYSRGTGTGECKTVHRLFWNALSRVYYASCHVQSLILHK